MNIVAILLRVWIIVVWVKMLFIWAWDVNSAPFVSGIWFILTWLYFACLSIFGPKAMLCPLLNKCGSHCKK